MLVQNVMGTFVAPAFAFFSEIEPVKPTEPTVEEREADKEKYEKIDQEYAAKLEAYEVKKTNFITAMEIPSLRDPLTLKFSLGSVAFDLFNAAINLHVFTMPESPKLIKRIEKQFVDFAQIADNEGEIEIPDMWIESIDKLFSDDKLFAQVALHGEISSNGTEKKALPVKGRVLAAMPKLNDALLSILPAV